jgi:hypothetical protein
MVICWCVQYTLSYPGIQIQAQYLSVQGIMWSTCSVKEIKSKKINRGLQQHAYTVVNMYLSTANT